MFNSRPVFFFYNILSLTRNTLQGSLMLWVCRNYHYQELDRVSNKEDVFGLLNIINSVCFLCFWVKRSSFTIIYFFWLSLVSDFGSTVFVLICCKFFLGLSWRSQFCNWTDKVKGASFELCQNHWTARSSSDAWYSARNKRMGRRLSRTSETTFWLCQGRWLLSYRYCHSCMSLVMYRIAETNK